MLPDKSLIPLFFAHVPSETIANYTFCLRKWKEHMPPHSPKFAVFADGKTAITSALNEVFGDQVVRLECNKHLSEHWPGFKTPGIERSEAHKAYWKTCKSATTAILEKNLTEMEKNISLSAANYLRGKSINRNDIACYNVQTNNFAEQFMNIADDQVCIFPLNRTFISLQFLTIDFSFLLFMFYLIIILLFSFLF